MLRLPRANLRHESRRGDPIRSAAREQDRRPPEIAFFIQRGVRAILCHTVAVRIRAVATEGPLAPAVSVK